MSVTTPEPMRIQRMFGSIASRYDLANTLLSFGIHHLWRRKLVEWSGVQEGTSVLDCATGTGDLAIAFKKKVGHGKVVGIDFCSEMLQIAAKKADDRELDIAFEKADCLNLPYEHDTFDITSIAFGIRNLSDPLKGISELARVTKPGGAVMVLEFGQPTLPLWKGIYSRYARYLLPHLGGMITGQKEAYRYLNNSSAQFPCRENFVKLMLLENAFQHVEYRSLSGGIAYLYRGIVGSSS